MLLAEHLLFFSFTLTAQLNLGLSPRPLKEPILLRLVVRHLSQIQQSLSQLLFSSIISVIHKYMLFACAQYKAHLGLELVTGLALRLGHQRAVQVDS